MRSTTMTPFPTQVSGAKFLASRKYGLLADEPRVGKTGAAIIAADLILARSILVITTASGRGVWKQGFADWSVFPRDVHVAQPGIRADADVVIVGWPQVATSGALSVLLQRRWDVLISDEDHYAKSFEARRTQAMYGRLQSDGALVTISALFATADRVWPLTGTPLPHSPADMYPRLRALAPERLLADQERGWPDVTRQPDFLHRYCIVKMKKLSAFRKIPVVIGGQRLDELRGRLEGFMLRRTQEDVGIRPPSYALMPFAATPEMLHHVDGDTDRTTVVEAAVKGDTKSLDMHLGPLRRITGEVKAREVVAAVAEEFACGLDRIVLAYWHKAVGEILMAGLEKFGVTGIDGSTPSARRAGNVAAFSAPKGPRVFLAQIEAAGEAIDLSAAAVLWFVETTFSPRAMKQMSLRITNHNQRRLAVVKVCTLQGSIDEALQASLLRLWVAIREVLK